MRIKSESSTSEASLTNFLAQAPLGQLLASLNFVEASLSSAQVSSALKRSTPFKSGCSSFGSSFEETAAAGAALQVTGIGSPNICQLSLAAVPKKHRVTREPSCRAKGRFAIREWEQ